MTRIFIILFLLFTIIFWAPWITKDYAKIKVSQQKSYRQTHSEKENIYGTMEVIWVPFGKKIIVENNVIYYVNCFERIYEENS